MSNSPEVATTNGQRSAGPVQLNLMGVAEAVRALSEQVAANGGREPLDRLVSVAVEKIPGARWASVSMRRGGHFTTAAATWERRYAPTCCSTSSGPARAWTRCSGLGLRHRRVGAEPRWSRVGQRASAEVGVNSVLSQRLHLHEQRVVAG